MSETPHLPINRENLARLTTSLGNMGEAARMAAERAEPVLRRALERMARHAEHGRPASVPPVAEGKA